MNPNTAIQIQNLSKQYRLGLVGTGTLSHDMKRWWTMNVQGKEDPYLKVGEVNDRASKGTSDYVWALKDINLEIAQGDVVGIIGKNGAGKSTLLKLLSRVTKPTTGTIAYRGRIASLLEVGTGFHPEMTGRENIYMNGAIMGMTRHEISRKLDEIIAFAGVERYIDTPVKRYSSGMTVRLGFAVAAHLEPDILVVDEVLAVGDAEFQKKAIGKMQDVSQQGGRTVLFVSHNMGSIKQLCANAILLKDGFINYLGDPDSAIARYIETNAFKHQELKTRTNRKGSGLAKFTNIEIIKNDKTIKEVQSGNEVVFKLEINAIDEIQFAEIALSIYNYQGILVASSKTTISHTERIKLKIGKTHIKCIFSTLPMQKGRYNVNVSLSALGNVLDWVENAYEFTVIENNTFKTGKSDSNSKAIVLLPNKWEFSI